MPRLVAYPFFGALLAAAFSASCSGSSPPTSDDETGQVSAAATTDTATYGFEDGLEGWQSSGSPITVGTSRKRAYAGSQSLAVAFSGASGTASARVASPSVPAGATITFHVWCPTGAGLDWVQPYALEGAAANWRWTGSYQAASAVATSSWHTIAVTLPSDATPLAELGVQFQAHAAGGFRCYVDSVGWTGASAGDAGAPDAAGGQDAGKTVDASGTDAATTADAGGSAPARWVLAYYVGYAIDAYPIAQIDWTGLTHIAFAPMTVNADQTLNLSFDDSHGTGQADAQALANAAHANGKKALLMLGGAGNGANIATAAQPGNRATFVSRLLSAMDSLGYDGIDIDWEESVTMSDLVGLAQALRAARPAMLLTYPAGAINQNYQTVDPGFATLAQSLDQFNVQTYYPSTAMTGSGWASSFLAPIGGESGSTPISIEETLGKYAAAGIPKAKLGMGTAFYAICYTGGITGPHQPTSSANSITGGDNAYPLSAFFAAGSTFDTSASASRQRDSAAQEPYLTFASVVHDSHCGDTQYVSYEDETAIVAKGQFAKSQGYGGIIVWTLNEGLLPANASGGRAPNALTQALRQGFLSP